MATHSLSLSGKPHGQLSLWATVHGVVEADTTEHTHVCSHFRPHLTLQPRPQPQTAPASLKFRGRFNCEVTSLDIFILRASKLHWSAWLSFALFFFFPNPCKGCERKIQSLLLLQQPVAVWATCLTPIPQGNWGLQREVASSQTQRKKMITGSLKLKSAAFMSKSALSPVLDLLWAL